MRRRFRLAVTIAALATPLMACDEKKAESESLVLSGRVKTPEGAYLPGVTVVARCGTFESRVSASDMGDYAVELPRTGCDRAIVTWEKESFSRNVRSFTLPVPRDSIALNVALAPLDEMICGPEFCSDEGVGGTVLNRVGGVARGFTGGLTGQEAVTAMPGEFFDTAGQPMLLLMTTQADLRDKTGAVIAPLAAPTGSLCSPLPETSYDELQDIQPGNEQIEFAAFTFDLPTGRWKANGVGYVAAGGFDDEGYFYAEAYQAAVLGDLRRGQLPKVTTDMAVGGGAEPTPLTLGGVWLCRPQSGTGTYGAGYTQPGKSCVVVEVRDACARPDATATVELFGRDRTFYNWRPTDADGVACLEAHRSEVIGESQSANDAEGETFWVDVNVTTADAIEKFEAVAMPTKDGNCGRPETCTVVRLARDPKVGQTSCVDAGVVAPAGDQESDAGMDVEGPIRLQGK